jgi:predicted acylesterase/phospholipase RssA
MPVVVAIRMSLSFPLLLSAIRLYTPHPTLPTVIESWMSDGGISSNFPIHFFDSWLPGHPTFGLDLQPFPGEDIEKDAPEVYMPASPEDPQYPHWTKVEGVGGFVRQIADVMENWRDTLQSELPGFRDRICQVRLREDEGGLNLDMDDEQIEALLERGRKAGVEIGRKFDWRQHRFARYLTFMQMMEIGLREAGERFDAFEPDLAAGVPGVEAYREGHDTGWFDGANRASRELFGVAAGWGVGFDRGYEPKPTPVMRVTPRA